MKNISQVLDCEEKDITDICVLKNGMTNSSFRFTCTKDGLKYVYRHPGDGTEAFINRKSEYFSMQVAKELNIDNSFIFMHPEARYPDIRKISRGQYEAYAAARGFDESKARRFLGHLL